MMKRREFLKGAAQAGGVAAMSGLLKPPPAGRADVDEHAGRDDDGRDGREHATSREKGRIPTASGAWKWDVDIYDRPGWNSFTYNFPVWGGIQKRKGTEIVLRFDTADAAGVNDDFYFEHYRQVAVSSTDGGMSWREIQPDWQYNMPLELSDGTRAEVVHSRRMLSRQEQKDRLKKLGIGHVWRDDCLLVWDLWPRKMAAQLRVDGYNVWDRPGPYLPEGVVATHALRSLVARRSTDNGRTWEEHEIADVGPFRHFGVAFPGSIVLPDDTILVPFYAIRKVPPDVTAFTLQGSEVFVLRSQDKGRTYQLMKLSGEAPKVRPNETSLVSHPSGRTVALMRSGWANIYSSVSDDGGKTWSRPKKTPMGGAPLSAIALASGNILCAYAHRSHPAGVRAALSHDRGETWDVANEKIIRDDSVPSGYNGGPGSVQLDDGSIFTFYSLVKGEKPAGGRPPHSYIAGSRYTEDYVRSLGHTPARRAAPTTG